MTPRSTLSVGLGGARVDVVNTIVRTSASKQTAHCFAGDGHFKSDVVFSTNGAHETGCKLANPTVVRADPQFVGGKGKHAYWLQPASPAIDAGTDIYPDRIRVDLSGAPRDVGAAPDMGAFEYRDE